MSKTYVVNKMSPDDVNTVYEEIYCKNNLITEDWFDEPFLNADTNYSKEDFLEIIEDDKIRSFVAVEQIALKQPNAKTFISNNKRSGFMCLEAQGDKLINLVFLEAINDSPEVYKAMLDYLNDKAFEKNFHKIVFEIQDGRWGQVKGASAAGFTLEKTVHCKDKADVYIYSKKIKQL